MMKLNKIGRFDGVTPYKRSAAPPDLVKRTQSSQFEVLDYYQLANQTRWQSWRRMMKLTGERERWLFFGCPPELAEDVVAYQRLIPYRRSFPMVWGPAGLYLFDTAERAARAALRFGREQEGLLISCRLATGTVYETLTEMPTAVAPPKGFDSICIRKGAQLGKVQTDGYTYVAFNPDQILLRFITHIRTS